MNIWVFAIVAGLVAVVLFCLFVALVSVYAQKALDEELPERCRNTKAPRIPR